MFFGNFNFCMFIIHTMMFHNNINHVGTQFLNNNNMSLLIILRTKLGNSKPQITIILYFLLDNYNLYTN